MKKRFVQDFIQRHVCVQQRFASCCFAMLLFASPLGAQEIPILDEPSADTLKAHKLLPSGLPDELNCQCPRHLAARESAKRPLGFTPAGVALLDSLPLSAEIIKPLRLADVASPDSLENSGYKRFYAMMQLKSMALDCGANALAEFAQTIEGDSLIFTATAIRIEKK
ncbi:MAG: hypothetical protein SNJ66_08935 [Chloroherpetonaceae bacterium]